MQLRLEAEKKTWKAKETVTVRLVAYNEAYEPVEIDRRHLVGPNPVPEKPGGLPMPVSLEPAGRRKEHNQVLLNPWCFYGRQRVFDNLTAGKVTFYGYLLRDDTGRPTPKGPEDAGAVLAAAEPLVLTIEG
jgi:hypothetical protein